MAVLNPLIETNNARFKQLARQVARIAKVINLDENPNDPNDAYMANVQPQPNLENQDHPEANILMAQHGPNANHFLDRVQNNVEGIKIKTLLQQSSKSSTNLVSMLALPINYSSFLSFPIIFSRLRCLRVGKSISLSLSFW